MTARLHTLSNGVRVVCDPLAGFETLALSVVIGRGSRFETKAQSGWAHLVEHMVFKGAGERSARDIVEAIEETGGHINAATGHERTSFQVRALKGGLPLAMAVISDLVFRPVIDAAELEREKAVIDQEIAEAADTPDDLVFDFAQTAAFGDTPLGRPILGKTKSVGGATAQTLHAFRAGLYAPDRIVVSCAGAVDEDGLLAQAERWFGAEHGPAIKSEAEPAAFAGGARTKGVKLETVDENGNYGIRMIVTRVSDLAAGDNHVLNYEDADGSARNPLASAGITSWPLKAKTGRLAGFNKKGESCISKV